MNELIGCFDLVTLLSISLSLSNCNNNTFNSITTTTITTVTRTITTVRTTINSIARTHALTKIQISRKNRIPKTQKDLRKIVNSQNLYVLLKLILSVCLLYVCVCITTYRSIKQFPSEVPQESLPHIAEVSA